jgi:hypothetical protein
MERAASTLSRRHLLAGVAGAAVVALVALPSWGPPAGDRARRLLAGNPLTRRFLSLAYAEMDEWAAQVGTGFTASSGHRLRLAGVRPLPSGGRRPASVARRRAFAAFFDITSGGAMAGDLIYQVRHRHYGTMPLFLTATSSPARMLAVFN